MATGNFYNKNASSIFAVLMGYESPVIDDNGNETDNMEYVYPNEWDRDDMLDMLYEAIRDIANNNNINICSNNSHDNDRNFSGRYICNLYISDFIANTDINITIKPVMRSGYYEGCNLDFDGEVVINNTTYDLYDIDKDYVIEELMYTNNHNKGLSVIQAKNILKFIDSARDRIIDNLEKIYRSYSQHELKTVGTFSNGEQVYSKVM